MIESSGGFFVRSFLRTILAVVLLLGSGAGDWAQTPTPAHESCCCGTPAGAEDRCPCPKPEGNRGPQRGACAERQSVVALQAARRSEQGQRRTEPRPEPATWLARNVDTPAGLPFLAVHHGRDPDLVRHLAGLGTFQI